MVTFPPEFVATKYPGYFWNVDQQRLYSIKVTGVLRPLVFRKASQWNYWIDGYSVSVNGKKRTLTLDYLSKLKVKPQVVPVAKS